MKENDLKQGIMKPLETQNSTYTTITKQISDY